MVSTFDEPLLTVKEYPFDVITMSETWLKNNELLLQHVTSRLQLCFETVNQ